MSEAPPPALESPALVCSFCGRGAREFQKIVEGKSGAHICDRCIREYYERIRRAPPRDGSA